MDLAGKAEAAQLELNHIDAANLDMTIPLARGLAAIMSEVSDTAWNIARIQFAPEWAKRFGGQR